MEKRIMRNLSLWLFLLLMLVLNTCGKFSSRLPMRKTWWAKRITAGLFVAGRLSEQQIKYASEDEFQSFVALYNYPQYGKLGQTHLPLTFQAKNIAEKLCGMRYEVLCPNQENFGDDEVGCWRTIDAIKQFDKIYEDLPKPVLMYSNTGYSATFVALAWLVYRTSNGLPVDVSVTPEDLYKRASGLGYDFSADEELYQLLKTISGQEVAHRSKPDLTLPDWHKVYWWLKPVEKNWYVSGQIRTDHLPLIETLGADVVLNSRLGVSWTDPDTGEEFPTQEEVTLLNVNDDCFTYCNGGRQSLQQLLENRIDTSKPAAYLTLQNTGEENYMSTNPWEFGDDIGYNETIEEKSFKNIPVAYVHTPIGGALGYDKHMLELYKSTWLDTQSKGNVVAHCRTGHRAVVSAILTLGQSQNKDMAWAIEKANAIGYTISEDEDPDVWTLFKYAFKQPKIEL